MCSMFMKVRVSSMGYKSQRMMHAGKLDMFS
jgi:hypothetical protein